MTEDECMEIAEANVLAQIANGGTSCHWCMDRVRIAAAKECVDLLQKMGEQRMLLTFDTSDHVRSKYAIAVINQHFGIKDKQ
jgi:hypothetical protein